MTRKLRKWRRDMVGCIAGLWERQGKRGTCRITGGCEWEGRQEQHQDPNSQRRRAHTFGHHAPMDEWRANQTSPEYPILVQHGVLPFHSAPLPIPIHAYPILSVASRICGLFLFLDHFHLAALFTLVFTYFQHGMMIMVSFPLRYRSSCRWQPPSSIYNPLRWPFHLVQQGHGIVDSSVGNAMLGWGRHRTIQTYCMYLSY